MASASRVEEAGGVVAAQLGADERAEGQDRAVVIGDQRRHEIRALTAATSIRQVTRPDSEPTSSTSAMPRSAPAPRHDARSRWPCCERPRPGTAGPRRGARPAPPGTGARRRRSDRAVCPVLDGPGRARPAGRCSPGRTRQEAVELVGEQPVVGVLRTRPRAITARSGCGVAAAGHGAGEAEQDPQALVLFDLLEVRSWRLRGRRRCGVGRGGHCVGSRPGSSSGWTCSVVIAVASMS